MSRIEGQTKQVIEGVSKMEDFGAQVVSTAKWPGYILLEILLDFQRLHGYFTGK